MLYLMALWNSLNPGIQLLVIWATAMTVLCLVAYQATSMWERHVTRVRDLEVERDVAVLTVNRYKEYTDHLEEQILALMYIVDHTEGAPIRTERKKDILFFKPNGKGGKSSWIN